MGAQALAPFALWEISPWPPLHMKLGLIQQFVKATDKAGEGFNFFKNKFPHLSESKIKERIFVGLQIRRLFNDSIFMEHLNPKKSEHGLHSETYV